MYLTTTDIEVDNMNEDKIERLEEYKKAYFYLMSYFKFFTRVQQRQINIDLNEIFKKNKGEQVEVV